MHANWFAVFVFLLLKKMDCIGIRKVTGICIHTYAYADCVRIAFEYIKKNIAVAFYMQCLHISN